MSKNFYIDVVDMCNLKCPSCPSRGSFISGEASSRKSGSSRFMDVELFTRILEKIKREHAGEKITVLPYIWGEPTLHPKIGEIIQRIKSYGFGCILSTNLNVEKHLEDVISAGPDLIWLSCSGFTKETYGVSHRGGDIDRFLANLARLRYYSDKHKSKTEIVFHYHLYKTNIHELSLLKYYMELFKFSFSGHSHPAYMPCLEEILAIRDGAPVLSDTRDVMSKMIFSIDEWSVITEPYKKTQCPLIGNRITLDANGGVMQCCAVYDKKYNIADNYLDIDFAEMQNRRIKNPICTPCRSLGLPYYHLAEESEPLYKLRMNGLLANSPFRQTTTRKVLGKIPFLVSLVSLARKLGVLPKR